MDNEIWGLRLERISPSLTERLADPTLHPAYFSIPVDEVAYLQGLLAELPEFLDGEFDLQDPDLLHITLAYIPDCNNERFQRLEEKLSNTVMPAEFKARAVTVESFREADSNPIILRVVPSPELLRIQSQIFNLAVSEGLECSPYSEPSAYKPHITLAYNYAGDLGDLPVLVEPIEFVISRFQSMRDDYEISRIYHLPVEVGQNLFTTPGPNGGWKWKSPSVEVDRGQEEAEADQNLKSITRSELLHLLGGGTLYLGAMRRVVTLEDGPFDLIERRDREIPVIFTAQEDVAEAEVVAEIEVESVAEAEAEIEVAGGPDEDAGLVARIREILSVFSNRLLAMVGIERGGVGSGNFGHAGRPGEVGGSAPSGSTPGVALIDPSESGDDALIDAMESQAKEILLVSDIDKDQYARGWLMPDGRFANLGQSHDNSAKAALESVGIDPAMQSLGDGFVERPDKTLIESGFIRMIYDSASLVYDGPSRLSPGQAEYIARLLDMRPMKTPYIAIHRGLDARDKELTGTQARNRLEDMIEESYKLIGRTRIVRGGPGSGNFGHAGRPGEVGGSAPEGVGQRVAVGRSIEDLFHVPGTERWDGVRSALSAIDKVHSIANDVFKIELKESRAENSSGGYFYAGKKGMKIAVVVKDNPDIASFSALSMLHEVGHWLDHMMLGYKGYFASAGDPPDYTESLTAYRVLDAVKNWWETVDNSDGLAKLREMKSGHVDLPGLDLGEGERGPYFGPNYKYYALGKEEVFARAYEQWIVTRSGDKDLGKALDLRLELQRQGLPATQWEHDDFKPIAEAMDEIFEAGEWLR